MQDPTASTDFINQATALIGQNMTNENFGVAELADAMHMSRSNLLRKVKKETGLSVSQLISQVRLQRAMELLRQSSLNVSEVSHEVGFGSVSYFIKCFREYYGYPPGEVGKRAEAPPVPVAPPPVQKGRWPTVVAGGLLLILIVAAAWYLNRARATTADGAEKSIAVLPFKNESNDSSNVYLINGLMESTLGNLQKVKDLRVISRTSSEKYRDARKSIPEMAQELNVNYFVEGSGQKIGDRIVLNIQLIDAANDRHLWSKQYRRETKDIFQLQQEVAKNIADEIRAIITPEEEQRINQKPTDNLEAYDWYLKGKNLQTSSRPNLTEAMKMFREAVTLDPEFALAYAEMAISCYYLDIGQAEKKWLDELRLNADKAMLYNPTLGESLMAKALDYISRKEYLSAEPFLEKALNYHPNSAAVVGFLSDYYGLYVLNTGKYLQYALKGIQLDIAAQDSVTASYTFLRLGNALIQNGFVDESLRYVDKALAYNPQNPWARYVRAFIMYAKTNNLEQTRSLLIEEYQKDSSRFDILQDIGKVSYYLRDYPAAYRYYQSFLNVRKARQLDVYRHENLNIAYTLAKVGQQRQADELVADYKKFIDADQSVYRDLGHAMYYSYQGERTRALEHMKQFAQQENIQYWLVLFLEADPLIDNVKNDREFQQYLKEVKDRFWKGHKALREVLSEKNLL